MKALILKRMNAVLYVMNSKDLCLIDHIPDLIEGGICSLKNRRA